MYEVVVDRIENDEPCEYKQGSTFYLKTMAELTDFLEICYRTKAPNKWKMSAFFFSEKTI